MGFHEVNGYWECDRCGREVMGLSHEIPVWWMRVHMASHPSKRKAGGETQVWKSVDSWGVNTKTVPEICDLCHKCARKVTKPLWKILNW